MTHMIVQFIRFRYYTISGLLQRVNILPINFNFTYTRKAMSQFGIHFIHVINFSNVQNDLCI